MADYVAAMNAIDAYVDEVVAAVNAKSAELTTVAEFVAEI